MIPLVVASERGTAQTVTVATQPRGSRTATLCMHAVSRIFWKEEPQMVKVQYAKLIAT